MENQLECKLFDRLGRTIEPTPKAEILYRGAKDILADLTQLRERVVDCDNRLSGSLVIGASTIPGTYLLPQMAAIFKQVHAAVSFEISIGDSETIIHNVLEQEILLGVVGSRPSSTKLLCVPYASDEIILAISPQLQSKLNLKQRKTGGIALSEFKKIPILQREQGSGTRINYEQFLERHQIHITNEQTSAVLGSSAAIKEAVKSALGAGFISRLAVNEELSSGIVCELVLDLPKLVRQFFIISSAKRTLPRSYKLFMEILKKK